LKTFLTEFCKKNELESELIILRIKCEHRLLVSAKEEKGRHVPEVGGYKTLLSSFWVYTIKQTFCDNNLSSTTTLSMHGGVIYNSRH